MKSNLQNVCIPLNSIFCPFFRLSLYNSPFHSYCYYPYFTQSLIDSSVFPASSHKILISYYLTSAREPRIPALSLAAFQAFKGFHNLTLFSIISSHSSKLSLCSHWHIFSFFYAFTTCLFLNLCLCLLYEFVFPESLRHISLKLKVLPYFPKIKNVTNSW